VTALIAILGPASKEILTTSDPVADQQSVRTFAARASAKTKLVTDLKQRTLRLCCRQRRLAASDPNRAGERPMVFRRGTSKQEILMRRIGGNELDAIEVCRGYVEAQNDYAEKIALEAESCTTHRKSSVRPGSTTVVLAGQQLQDESPIGDIIAKAFTEGYTNRHDPYHGYYFKILTGQGRTPPAAR